MRITCALIVEAVSEYFSVSVQDIRSTRRVATVVLARHVACYLARKMTTKSLPEIGRDIGGRDHTTVLYSCQGIDAYRHDKPDFAAKLIELEGIIAIAAGAITQLNFELPKDIDVRDVAQRLISQPLTQFTLSIDEVRAMALALLAEKSCEAPQGAKQDRTDENGAVASCFAKASQDLEPNIFTVTLDPDTDLRAAAKTVNTAFGKFQNDRFSRGEMAALERLNEALSGLKTTLEQQEKAA